MSAETLRSNQSAQEVKTVYRCAPSGAVYGMGLIGAWVYYFSQAATLQDGLLAFFQGLFWPAFLIYELLMFLT